MPSQLSTPPRPRIPRGTAQARPASRRNASPAPRHEARTASCRCRGRRARGRPARGAGMAAMPAGCAARPEGSAPTILSTRRAGRARRPARSLYNRSGPRSRERARGATGGERVQKEARAPMRGKTRPRKPSGGACRELRS